MTAAARLALAALLALAPAAARADHMSGPGMGGPGMGGPPPGPPAFMNLLFSPKLVMEHQQEIGLRPEQVKAIKQAMSETQQQLVDLQWRLEAETETLGKLLGVDRVDEAAVLAKLEQVTALEQQVKKVNFGLLVKIKNQLDPAQQEKLRALRPARPFGPPGPPP